MNIAILGIGSRGDVQPLVALGAGLQLCGHHVRFVAGSEFEDLITGASLTFASLGINMQETMEAHSNIFVFLKSITDRILAVCDQDQDAIISTALGVSTCRLARERGIPFFYAVAIPSLRTTAFPDPLFPPLPLGKAYHKLSHILMEQLAVRSYPWAKCLLQSPRPTYLFNFSSHVIPRPRDWGSFAHITGYWFLEHSPDWRPPKELIAFLEADTPPIYVGFGSTNTGNPQAVAQLAMQALDQANQRGILVSGWGGLQAKELPRNVFTSKTIPFDWLFPRVAMAVHHGGAGTTAAAMRAGIPSVIIPFGLDQPFWGRKVEQLGVGPAPISPKKLTADRLAHAIRSTLQNQSIRRCANDLGVRIRQEDGVRNAVNIIENVMAAANLRVKKYR